MTYFIDTHLGHLQQLGDSIHHADTRPTLVLPLSKVEDRHHRRLLVLRWISGDDVFRSLHVVGGKFEGDLELYQRDFPR